MIKKYSIGGEEFSASSTKGVVDALKQKWKLSDPSDPNEIFMKKAKRVYFRYYGVMVTIDSSLRFVRDLLHHDIIKKK